MLKEIIAEEVGLKDGEIIASSKGLHCYSYVEDFVKQRTGLNPVTAF
jgi:thymidylate synthase